MTNKTTETFASSDEAFAKLLKRHREKIGLTQDEVASEMARRGHDFHQQTVYKIEQIKRKVTVGEALALASVLDVELDDLTWEPPEPAASPYEVVRNAGLSVLMDLDALTHSVKTNIDVRRVLREALRGYEPEADATIEVTGNARYKVADALSNLANWNGLDLVLSTLNEFWDRVETEAACTVIDFDRARYERA